MSTPVPAPASALTAYEAYEQLAEHYDDFTAHHDYELWLGNLLERAAAHGLAGPGRLLDVGCGTGKSFLPMLQRGWEVTATDLSPAMAAQARAKAPRAKVGVADMRALPRLGSFDLVWCLDDAVNYLADERDLTRALTAMARNLDGAGLLVFDLNTLRTYRTFFAETQVLELANGRLQWRGQGDGTATGGGTYEAVFEITPAAGVPSRATHRQRHFTVAEVESSAAAAGLRIAGLYGHGFDAVLEQPLDESHHTKAVVFACNP